MKRFYTLFLILTFSISFPQVISKKDTISPTEKKTPKSKRDLIKELLEADLSKKSKKSQGVKDITGLAFKTGSSASIPEKYREVALENNWNPNAMSHDDMEKEYNLIMRGKYLRWFYIAIGITSIVFSIRFILKIIK